MSVRLAEGVRLGMGVFALYPGFRALCMCVCTLRQVCVDVHVRLGVRVLVAEPLSPHVWATVS